MKMKIERHPNLSMRRRSFVILVGIMFVFAIAVTLHLFNISVLNHSKYEKLANDYHFGTMSISADRGAIYDANGTPLAWSATVYKVYIDSQYYREEIENFNSKNQQIITQKGAGASAEDGIVDTEKLQDELVSYLSQALSIEPQEILDAMQKDTRYYVLQTQVEKPVADEILAYTESIDIDSIATEADTKRYYTQNELAAAVIGFTNGDGDGQYGIEKYYDDHLSGTDGRIVSAKDGKGNEMPYRNSQTFDAINGDSVYLTIDVTMQYYLEKNLEDMCDDFQIAERACGIIMNAKTGAVYAMATVPSFDLNNPSEIYDKDTAKELKKLPVNEYDEAYAAEREKQWKNKAVSEIYIPGSVFKVFTASAALDEKTIDPDTFGYTCGGEIQVADATLYCSHRAGHGTENFQQAMTNSCNPAFVKIGQTLGVGKFSQYFRAFGLSEKTGIDLPAEAEPIFYAEDRMGIVELSSASFGQSTKLTPIEMITGYASVINGGYLLEPYVVSEIKDSNSNTIMKNTKNVKRQVVSEETSEKMQSVLYNVVQDAPASNAYIAGYKIGGKSGTAQKNDEYDITDEANMQYVASYCCFAPADDPEIIMLIMADEPNKEIGYYGSQVVVPYSTKIMKEILPYLGYYPEYTDSDYTSLTAEIPQAESLSVEEAQEKISDAGLTYKIFGDGETVTAQTPDPGTIVLSGGSVILYTDAEPEKNTVVVPDVIGCSLAAAKNLLVENGLNLYISDAAETDSELVVTSQGVEAGTEVYQGSIINLNLGEKSYDSDDDEFGGDGSGGAHDAYNNNFVED